MVARDRTTILAAEPDRAAGKSLVKCLELLGYEPRLATTEKELLGLLRRELFRGAVVAAELGESGGGCFDCRGCRRWSVWWWWARRETTLPRPPPAAPGR